MKALLRKPFRAAYFALYGKNGKRITINNESYTVSAHIARGIQKTIDETPLRILQALSKNARVVFDLGANIGLVSVITAKSTPKGSVIYAFEPSPTTFKYLKDNARVQTGNATIKPYNLAISDKPGEMYFTNNPAHTLNHLLDKYEDGCVTVKAQSLDSFCQKEGVYPDVIKIDIEGAEYFALQGMINVLKNSSPTIVMEVHTEAILSMGVTKEMFTGLLKDIGYTLYNSSGNRIGYDEIIFNACVVLSKSELPKFACY